MQGLVLIVCMPSNSPQSPGLSSHSIHPGLCLVSNLNLTHWTRGKWNSSFFSLHLQLLCIFWSISLLSRHKMSLNMIFFFQIYGFVTLTHCSGKEGVMIGGCIGSRWTWGGGWGRWGLISLYLNLLVNNKPRLHCISTSGWNNLRKWLEPGVTSGPPPPPV